MTRTVLVTDYYWKSLDVERRIFAEAGLDVELIEARKDDDLAVLAARADAILTCWRPVDARVLDAAVNCRVVSRYGVGVDNVDVEHATAKNIMVANVPDYCTDEVADHTILMLLAVVRRLNPLTAAKRGGIPNGGPGMPPRLRGLTLGLVGLGAIGREVVPRAQALGLNVLAYTRNKTAEGVRVTNDLKELLSTADIVSLHLPLTAETANLIGAEEIALMKPGSYLINTARGGLVDTDALTAALYAGHLAGVGLDVTTPEPLPADHPLRSHPEALITPHIAYLSDGAAIEILEKAARNVADVFQGKLPAGLINPETAPNQR